MRARSVFQLLCVCFFGGDFVVVYESCDNMVLIDTGTEYCMLPTSFFFGGGGVYAVIN